MLSMKPSTTSNVEDVLSSETERRVPASTFEATSLFIESAIERIPVTKSSIRARSASPRGERAVEPRAIEPPAVESEPAESRMDEKCRVMRDSERARSQTAKRPRSQVQTMIAAETPKDSIR